MYLYGSGNNYKNPCGWELDKIPWLSVETTFLLQNHLIIWLGM